MTDLLDIDRLSSELVDRFRDAVPNGWLLGWDRNRFRQQFAEASKPIIVTNNTSFDYSRCNQYDFETVHAGSKCFLLLTLRLSFILPYFCLHWTEYDETKTHGRVVQLEGDELEKKIRGTAQRLGFEELPDAWLGVRVSGIQLELSEDENVTISKCLFDDYSG